MQGWVKGVVRGTIQCREEYSTVCCSEGIEWCKEGLSGAVRGTGWCKMVQGG